MSKKYRERYLELRQKAFEFQDFLVQKYPKAFFPKDSIDTKPLAIGIRMAVVRDNPDIEWKIIAATIGNYTKKTRYQRALASCEHRINLDGSQASQVKPNHREFAIQTIAERQARLLENLAA